MVRTVILRPKSCLIALQNLVIFRAAEYENLSFNSNKTAVLNMDDIIAILLENADSKCLKTKHIKKQNQCQNKVTSFVIKVDKLH